MKILAGLLIAIFGIAAYAQKPDGEWNWYYATFYSPTTSKVLLRSGTASVKISQSKIVLHFVEKDVPEMQASFSGLVTGNGNIRGTLKGFFPSGVENLSGTYRKMGERKTCRWQEIIFRPSVPNGSTLVLSRIEGPCQ